MNRRDSVNTYDSICCFRNRHTDGYRILLEITDQCNANCLFCHWKDKSSLSLDHIKIIFNNLGTLPIHDVILSGGEPLLHPELFDILEWFHAQRIECDLCSNGLLIDHKMAKKLAAYLSEISISLDTIEPEKYDYLRGTKGGFKRVVDGIEFLQREGVSVHLTCVVTKENEMEIEDYVNFSKKLDLHSVSFLGVISDIAKRKDDVEQIALSIKEKEAVMKRINHIRNSMDKLLINTKRLAVCEGEVCRAGENILGITSEGNIMGCIMHRDVCGNMIQEYLDDTLLEKLKGNKVQC